MKQNLETEVRNEETQLNKNSFMSIVHRAGNELKNLSTASIVIGTLTFSEGYYNGNDTMTTIGTGLVLLGLAKRGYDCYRRNVK